MILTFEQVKAVVIDNPNKAVVKRGTEQADKLMMHLHGVGMKQHIHHMDYFESTEVHKTRSQYAISNKDLFSRLLQQEDMVFSARGGSTYFSLPDSEESQMNEILDDVRYNMSLRKWVRNFALQAYRADPMGIVFMEVEPLIISADGSMNEPKAYPTYKSIYSIFDYMTTGRRLEYVCFQLTVGECKAYGITDEAFKGQAGTAKSEYYRIVDDLKDLIVQKKDGNVILTTNITQRNPLPNEWKKTPGFVISDLIQFNDPRAFVSPLDFVVELADTFLQDRSVRDLQKKYHGFSKAIEPLLTCSTCHGEGVVSGLPCRSCTPAGADRGTGFKLQTKVSDVARFPLEIFKESSFDFNKIFGYVTPDIKGWEKQDMSLDDLEEMIEMTYWGTVRMTRPKPGGDPITATESKSNDTPKEARLNMTADWAEKTESMIADFIGRYWFETSWRRASISYGRDYILKTADELMDTYQTMRTKGAPDFSLDEALERYYRALHQNNPAQMTKFLKMLDVEPFPHMKVTEAKGVISDFGEFNAKLYFGEWKNTIPDAKWISPAFTPQVLIKELKAYVAAKGLTQPVPEPASFGK